MSIEVGSYDAKTKLPELLREVQSGHRFTITLRGKPVAQLVPVEMAGVKAAQEAIAAMISFPKVKGVNDSDLQSWISEGRH